MQLNLCPRPSPPECIAAKIYSHDVHMYVSVSLERHTYFSTCIIGSACLQDTYGSQDQVSRNVMV